MANTSNWACRLLGLAVAIFATPAGAAELPTSSLAGAPSPLITDQQRNMLGLDFGPDAPIDFFQKKSGEFYINSSGGVGLPDEHGTQGAFNLHVDAGLTRILALDGGGPARGLADVE